MSVQKIEKRENQVKNDNLRPCSEMIVKKTDKDVVLHSLIG